MTESEAREKLCPVLSTPSMQDESLMYRDGEAALNSVYCIASDCACWVWERRVFKEPNKPDMEGVSNTHGHCGLIR